MTRRRQTRAAEPPALSPVEREALLRAAGLELAPDGVRSTAGLRPLVRKLSQCWRNSLTVPPADEPVWRDLAGRGLARVVREPVGWLAEPVFAVTAEGLAALWDAGPEAWRAACAFNRGRETARMADRG